MDINDGYRELNRKGLHYKVYAVAVEVKKNEHVPDVRVVVAHSLHQDGEHGIAFLRDYTSR